MSTPNKYANHKPSEQLNTSGQRRVRREQEQREAYEIEQRELTVQRLLDDEAKEK